MFRRHVITEISAAAAIVLILTSGCGDDSSGPNTPVRLPTDGISDLIYVNVCRKDLLDQYVYDDCSDSAANAACVEFRYEKATAHLCSLKTCGGTDTLFMVRVTCWKPSASAPVILPDSLVDSIVPLRD